MNRKKEIRLENTKIVLYSCLSNTSDLSNFRENFDEVANKPIHISNLEQILFNVGLAK